MCQVGWHYLKGQLQKKADCRQWALVGTASADSSQSCLVGHCMPCEGRQEVRPRTLQERGIAGSAHGTLTMRHASEVSSRAAQHSTSFMNCGPEQSPGSCHFISQPFQTQSSHLARVKKTASHPKAEALTWLLSTSHTSQAMPTTCPHPGWVQGMPSPRMASSYALT